MADKKMTYGNAIDNAIEVLNAQETVDTETVARLEELKDALAKRNAGKSNKNTEKAELIKSAIITALEGDKALTLTEIVGVIGSAELKTPQSIATYANALVESGELKTETVKGKKLYSINA